MQFSLEETKVEIVRDEMKLMLDLALQNPQLKLVQ
jgi:hypothetical protein